VSCHKKHWWYSKIYRTAKCASIVGFAEPKKGAYHGKERTYFQAVGTDDEGNYAFDCPDCFDGRLEVFKMDTYLILQAVLILPGVTVAAS
jgi:hypothetical protein